MFEAYKVAVRLSLINGVSSGLVTMASQFQALNKHIGSAQSSLTALERQLLNLKRMGLVGGAMAAAGGFGLSLFSGPLQEAKQWQLEMEKFRALGVGDAVTRDAVKFSEGIKTYGTSMRENIGLLRDAQTIFGDFEHAKTVTPLLAQMKFANAAMYGSEGGAMKDRSFMDMLKVIELRKGLTSEDAFRTQANMVQQVQTATGGRVGASEYLNLIKTGGVAAKSLKDDVFYYKMEPLIQEMGGNRIGTGLMSAYTNLILGRTTVQTAKELERLGMLDPSHIEYNKIGMIKRILPGGLKGGDQMMADPIAFLENTMLPAFRAKGITSEQDTLRELGLVFSNRTASQLFSTIFLQMENIKKNEALNRGAMNIDQLDKTARNTAIGKEMELHARWKDVLKELGTAVLPIAIKGVTWLTEALKGAIFFAKEFPLLTKGIVIAFGALSAVVAVGGTLTLATAGFKTLGIALGGLSGTLGAGGAAGAVGGAAGAGGLIGKIGALGGAFGVLSAAAAPLLAMMAFTNWAGDTSHDKERVGTLSGWSERLKGLMPSWMGDPTGKSRDRYAAMRRELDGTGGDYVRPGSGNNSQAAGDVYLDREKVGKVLWNDMNKELRRPMAGTSRPDGRMSMTPVGASGRG